VVSNELGDRRDERDGKQASAAQSGSPRTGYSLQSDRIENGGQISDLLNPCKIRGGVRND